VEVAGVTSVHSSVMITVIPCRGDLSSIIGLVVAAVTRLGDRATVLHMFADSPSDCSFIGHQEFSVITLSAYLTLYSRLPCS